MNPVFIIAIPLGLVILGMILNSWDLGYNQPPSSAEQDPLKKLTAEKESYRKFLATEKPIVKAPKTDRPVWLVGYGCLYRRLHLAVHGHCDQDGPFESNRRASNLGNRRRQADGSLGDSERWEQRQIPDQIASASQQGGDRRKRRG